ncbi:Hypothetical predicted protein [Lynx pardinus]|uniref:Lipase maturation factor n=1 Tax=Lynx pardinus TaxID=191816 RepID=A0A485PT89_LYNPA|nr:Hypothetical predicted protein [Lynx pardinus]
MAAPEETLRRRKAGNSGPEPETPPESGRDPTGCPARLRTGTFWLTRIVLLRALAFIYFVAFLVALHQNKQLIGDRGLLPCRAYLESVQRYFRGRGGWDAVSYAPTVLWLLDWSHMNANLDALALLGLGVSSFVLVTGCANVVLMATLWVLYMSLVNVGQIWYSFGKWKSESDAVGVWHVCGVCTRVLFLPLASPESLSPRWLMSVIEPGVLAHAGFRARSAGPVQTWGLVTLGCAVGRRQRQMAVRVAPPQRVRSVLTDQHCSLGEGQAVLQANPSPPRAVLSARDTPGQRRSSPRAEGSGTARGGPISLLGWESQLLETGFLGIFLCPLWTLSRLPTGTPPSQIVLWGFRWLIFRIMLGAGLIKIRGDRCWRDLTCMDFHYEVVLVISGNLSFLNWLTMVPSVACFDDATLGFLFPSAPGGLKDRVRKMQEEAARGARPTLRYGCVVRQAVHVALGILVAWLSVPVVLNLLSPTQVMNTSFNSLRIVNTYGAFGSITKERTEVILQGTASPNASAPDAVWEDYGFKCKPGDPGRRPCLISPYHYRLDWLMWFAAFQTYEHNEWIIHLAGKLLANDREAVSLLAFNPFKDRAPPRWVRGEHYRYKFSRLGGRHAAAGRWWVRKRIGPYFPPLSLRDLEGYFRSRDWPLPELE